MCATGADINPINRLQDLCLFLSTITFKLYHKLSAGIHFFFCFSRCPLKFAFLQYHRIAGVGKDLKRTSSPTPLLKRVPYSKSHR